MYHFRLLKIKVIIYEWPSLQLGVVKSTLNVQNKETQYNDIQHNNKLN
jgi:hypothetical protein